MWGDSYAIYNTDYHGWYYYTAAGVLTHYHLCGPPPATINFGACTNVPTTGTLSAGTIPASAFTIPGMTLTWDGLNYIGSTVVAGFPVNVIVSDSTIPGSVSVQYGGSIAVGPQAMFKLQCNPLYYTAGFAGPDNFAPIAGVSNWLTLFLA